MTIEEKSRNYAGYDVKPTPDIVTEIRMARIRDDFKAGAEWMLEKACEYMKNQYPAHYQDYQEWVELADEYVKQFKKAMEE